MTSDQNSKKQLSNPLDPQKVAQVLATTIITHPMTLVKTNIQLGYEPLPASSKYFSFFKKGPKLPGLIPYSSKIVSEHGFFGLWRGVTGHTVSALTYYLAKHGLGPHVDQFFDDVVGNPDSEKESESEPNYSKDEIDQIAIKITKKCVKESLRETVCLFLAHPFYVWAIRSMGQLAGKENAYDTLLSSFKEIVENEGWSGFFKGLTAKIIFGISSIWVYEIGSQLVRKAVAVARENTDSSELDNESRQAWDNNLQIFEAQSQLIAKTCLSSFVYPLNLTSIVMTTSGSRLVCATEQKNWYDQYKQLKLAKQAQRGSAIFFGRSLPKGVAAFSDFASGL